MTEDRVLDWKPRFDEKSRGFAMARADCFTTGIEPGKRFWTRKRWFDQGSEGACTGFSTAHAITTTPRSNLDIGPRIARNIYYAAQRLDQWEGEDYEGSSVLGAMKASKRRDFITSYRWCFTLDEIIHAVSYHGPVVMGVNWYSGMFRPDPDGVLRVSGNLSGGHAIQVGGVDPEKRVFRLDNSWGREWGVNGSCLLTFSDMYRLLTEQGEFALPSKPVVT